MVYLLRVKQEKLHLYVGSEMHSKVSINLIQECARLKK